MRSHRGSNNLPLLNNFLNRCWSCPLFVCIKICTSALVSVLSLESDIMSVNCFQDRNNLGASLMSCGDCMARGSSRYSIGRWYHSLALLIILPFLLNWVGFDIIAHINVLLNIYNSVAALAAKSIHGMHDREKIGMTVISWSTIDYLMFSYGRIDVTTSVGN